MSVFQIKIPLSVIIRYCRWKCVYLKEHTTLLLEKLSGSGHFSDNGNVYSCLQPELRLWKVISYARCKATSDSVIAQAWPDSLTLAWSCYKHAIRHVCAPPRISCTGAWIPSPTFAVTRWVGSHWPNQAVVGSGCCGKGREAFLAKGPHPIESPSC